MTVLKRQKGVAISLLAIASPLFFFMLMLPLTAYCQQEYSVKELKRLSMEDLMDLEITSVSRRSEKLIETPSAIQVITNEAISKFAATNIPEALYLAGNLQVTQKGSHSWGVSARGFNTDLANKLLVMIDGRTVYTPLFSGVFWDRQDYLLNDIDRIEVISGPGGTLWGANAVNGVINITTKDAGQTQGLYMEGGGGNELHALTGVRYGGKLGNNTYYRVYGKYANRDGAVFPDSTGAHDAWTMLQGGFRLDASPTSKTTFTLQGDIYDNNSDLATGRTSDVIGNNILGRWVHNFSEKSNMRLQAYYDHTYLYDPTQALIINGTLLAPEGIFKDDLTTYDVDFQHQLNIKERNYFVWGLGYRFTHDHVTNSPALGFFPTTLDQHLFTLFAQDEITITDAISLTLGSKLEHNPYVGFFAEPNGRVRWKLNDKQIVWAAVSRAVRAPSRIDRHLSEGTPPNFVLLRGDRGFQNETVNAWEAGYRSQISNRATTSVSLFYNQYDHVRSTILDPVNVFPLYFRNGLEGETYGMEINVTLQVTDWWRLFTSYNLLREDIRVKKEEADFNNAHNETADPGWQFTLRSSFDLPGRFDVNGNFRWIDALPINDAGVLKTVPSYAELDAQVSWHATNHLDILLAGRNLLHAEHVEYGIPNPSREAIQRSVYAKAVLKL